MASKLEINIRSLIINCEEMVKEESNNWMVKKYIKSLDTMIGELESSDEPPSSSTIDEYKERCSNLKKVTKYVEPTIISTKLKLKTASAINSTDHINREINQLQDAKYTASLRKDLLGEDSDGSSLRKRAGAGSGSGGGGADDMKSAIKYHDDLQDKIAQDILILTRNLKEQTITANQIIKKDTEIVTKSTKLSENNTDALTKETSVLQNYSKRACKCWMWMMILIVMIIFIFMVLFIKIMKKRAS